MSTRITPDARGRLLLPAAVRKALGLDEQREVAVELRKDGSVVIRDPVKVRAAAVRRMKGSARGEGGSIAELHEDRRREAALEDEKELRVAGSA
jgi:bifunctional DNA-binding transcriptional regulator/antitoxin component of YhaV-PrlF toxin-antitoxin module